MSKRRFYFHISLLLAALIIGCWSLWLDEIVSSGKNFPNLTALTMVFMVIGQFIQIFPEVKKILKCNRNADL